MTHFCSDDQLFGPLYFYDQFFSSQTRQPIHNPAHEVSHVDSTTVFDEMLANTAAIATSFSGPMSQS